MVDVKYDIMEVLQHINPALLDYQDWINVGFALKDAGYSCADWDSWSARDTGRYKAGECTRKWNSFNGVMGNPITAGTIVQLAREQGWSPSRDRDPGHELDWDSEIGAHDYDEHIIIDKNWIENKDVPEPDDWNPIEQLTRYLGVLFEASETVGYVTDTYQNEEGKYLPQKGAYDRSAGQLIEELNKCNGDIGAVIGDMKPEAGAWIRFNPLDGKGVKNENVTEYRYALVESDSMPIEQQNAIIHELELPVAMLVHSGKKSLHAIVRIDAANYDEYRKRVDYLYDICKKNGLMIDKQNRNPARLSRMPGVMRNGQKQFIVAENIGKTSYVEWFEWIESVNDDLPEPESMADVWDNLPELSPPLIQNVLRQGHKLLLAGPSKAGKSFSLIQLCIAVAEGTKWMGWQCAKGRVLYVNLELDRASCLNRFKDVYGALTTQPNNIRNIDIWNLRGKSLPMDKLAPKLIRRAAKKNYIAIIIDPIYKVITGDENSADQMANFCNQFDKVCTELGCAVIYCHHHSKGGQGQKRSMDRASGSGVFARDPDAMLDMIELEISDALRAFEIDRLALSVCKRWLNNCVKDWQNEISQDDQCSFKAMLAGGERLLSSATFMALTSAIDAAREAAKHHTAWRIEGTLREFARFDPVNLWFTYPIHCTDSVGSLQDAKSDGDAKLTPKKTPADRATDRRQALENAFDQAYAFNDGDVNIRDIMQYTSFTRNTVKTYIDDHEGFKREKDGRVFRVSEISNDTN